MQAGNNLRFGVKIWLGEVEIRNKIIKNVVKEINDFAEFLKIKFMQGE